MRVALLLAAFAQGQVRSPAPVPAGPASLLTWPTPPGWEQTIEPFVDWLGTPEAEDPYWKTAPAEGLWNLSYYLPYVAASELPVLLAPAASRLGEADLQALRTFSKLSKEEKRALAHRINGSLRDLRAEVQERADEASRRLRSEKGARLSERDWDEALFRLQALRHYGPKGDAARDDAFHARARIAEERSRRASRRAAAKLGALTPRARHGGETVDEPFSGDGSVRETLPAVVEPARDRKAAATVAVAVRREETGLAAGRPEPGSPPAAPAGPAKLQLPDTRSMGRDHDSNAADAVIYVLAAVFGAGAAALGSMFGPAGTLGLAVLAGLTRLDGAGPGFLASSAAVLAAGVLAGPWVAALVALIGARLSGPFERRLERRRAAVLVAARPELAARPPKPDELDISARARPHFAHEAFRESEAVRRRVEAAGVLTDAGAQKLRRSFDFLADTVNGKSGLHVREGLLNLLAAYRFREAGPELGADFALLRGLRASWPSLGDETLEATGWILETALASALEKGGEPARGWAAELIEKGYAAELERQARRPAEAALERLSALSVAETGLTPNEWTLTAPSALMKRLESWQAQWDEPVGREAFPPRLAELLAEASRTGDDALASRVADGFRVSGLRDRLAQASKRGLEPAREALGYLKGLERLAADGLAHHPNLPPQGGKE